MLITLLTMQKILHHAQEDNTAYGVLIGDSKACLDALPMVLPAQDNNINTLLHSAAGKAAGCEKICLGIYLAGEQKPALPALSVLPPVFSSTCYCFWVALNEKGVLEVNAYQWLANEWQLQQLALLEH